MAVGEAAVRTGARGVASGPMASANARSSFFIRSPGCYNLRMSTITVQEIQRDQADFIHRLKAGHSFSVVQGDETLAEVHPVPPFLDEPRPYGLCAGQFIVPDDFNAPLSDDVLAAFEGR